jgi:hypothetical protein
MVSGLVEAVSMNPSLTTKKGKVEMDSGVCLPLAAGNS